ncbi:nuclear transport factor 2 family protein [Spirillospora sp. CA-255316]
MDDIEAIKQLKARYCRTLDTKDWDAMRQVFTDDVVIDTTGSGGTVISGAGAFMAFLLDNLADRVTVHHCHTPEITLTSPSTATGVWAMEDRVQWPGGRELNGFGHYHETYEKSGGTWRIKTSTLTRLRMDVTEPAAT